MSGRGRRTARRNVVVVFIDLVGSTELAERLDPELLQQILERYHDVCTAGIFEHGGVVEKYIGDAIMAVFGVPVSREDDALRAVRAAHAAMTAVQELGAGLTPTHGVRLNAHCGVAFGEVMVVDGGPDLRVVGDTVNTAARLQSAAGDGEILVGGHVASLVRDHAELMAVPPLTLKGKRDPVAAWRLQSIAADAAEREADSIPLIGRVEELQQLAQIHERIVRDRRCCMATILGVPGIGKSRLVREFVHALPEGVTVLTGRCPSYGVGVTYRPIAELLETLNGDWGAIADAVGPEGARALRGLAGAHAGDDPGAAGIEEIARAVRSVFEVLAQTRPLVVVLDNLQWAEPTLLDLIEECAAWLADVPVLFVCVARSELLETRPVWGGGMACAMSLELGPLGRAHMARLVTELCSERADVAAHDLDTAYRKVAYGSDGNPLFAELMLEALVSQDGAALPPTVQALLGAWLDRLGQAEREVLERAATVGQSFLTDQIEALFDDEPIETAAPLQRLLRNRMIRRGAMPGSYEFTQTLTRENVYAMTRKDLRAAWHRRLADWLADRAADTTNDAPFRGATWGDVTQHLQAACLLTREVQPDDPLLPELADRAADALIRDGGQALHRKDLPAAIALLERGREMLPAGRAEHRLLAVRISDAELSRGQSARAAAALDLAEELLPGGERNELTCAIQREILALRSGAREARPGSLRERLDPEDDLGWCLFHQLDALVHIEHGRFGSADRALREGLARAREMGDRYEEDRLLGGLCELAQWSPAPVGEGLAICADLRARFAGDRALLVPVLTTKARLLALAGDLTGADEALDTADRYAADLNLGLAAIAVLQVRALVGSLVGRHGEAERMFWQAAAALRAAGQGAAASTLEVYAARELFRQGRAERAGHELAEVKRSQLRGEVTAQALRAGIASAHGTHADAIEAAEAALALLESTDDPCLRGDVLFEIAKVHRGAGRDAVGAASQAIQEYEKKAARLPVEKVHAWMEEPPQ